MILEVIFFVFLNFMVFFFFCFVVDNCDLVHDVEAIHGLS